MLKYAAKVFFDGRLGDWRYMQMKIKYALKASRISTSEKLPLASRTDAGVWCLGQVIAFHSNVVLRNLKRINAFLPRGLALYALAEVDEKFSPRKAESRTYVYIIPYFGENIDTIKRAAELFIGTHDFWNFSIATRRENTIRTIYEIKVEKIPDFLIITFRGKGFLNKMIRKIAWCLVAAGRGDIDLDFIEDRLERKVDSKVPSLPPEGLFLLDVEYSPRILFSYDKNTLKDILHYLKTQHTLLKTLAFLCSSFIQKISSYFENT